MNSLLQSVSDAYAEALAARSAAWCQLHPRQDGTAWSAQELIEHLVLTMNGTRQLLETRLERGRPTRRRATPIQHLCRVAVLSLRRMPRGVTAPPFTVPGQTRRAALRGAELAELLRDEYERMDQLLDVCTQRFGKQRVAAHFLLGPLSAEEWRRFHSIHGRHHLKQLSRIERANPDPAIDSESGSPVQVRRTG